MVVNTDDLAFGYIRVSTEAQADEEKVSLETQADDIKEYSDAHGIKLVEIFRDVGSGEDPNRPNFQRMLARLKEGRVRKVVIWNLQPSCPRRQGLRSDRRSHGRL